MILSSPNNCKVTLNEMLGVICIDVWDSEGYPPSTWPDNVDRYINFTQFENIVVANYELALDSLNDLSQYNTLETYSWSTFRPEILLPIMKEAGKRKTHPWLKSKFSSNSFLILDPVGLKIHVENTVPHIKNWLVLGGLWQRCTHQRPLGFNSMMNLPYNFFTTPWSVYKDGKPMERSQFELDTLCWIDHGNNLFQLKNT